MFERVNAKGTIEVARAAAAAGVGRFVLISSVKAMRAPGPQPITEADPGMPVNPYGLSKRRAEAGARAVAAGTGMDVVVVRSAVVYGPGVTGNLASLLDALLKGLRPPIPNVPNRRSMLGLVDLVRVTRECAFESRQPKRPTL